MSAIKTKSYRYSNELPRELESTLPILKKIFDMTFELEDNTSWQETYLKRGRHTSLTLYYSEDNLVGYSCSGINVYKMHNRTYAVFNAGVYSDMQSRLGPAASLGGLWQALRYKIMHPSHYVAYLTDAATPASYCLLMKLARKCYPHAMKSTPAFVNEILNHYIEQYRFKRVHPDNFIVKFPYERKLKSSPDRFSSSTLRYSRLYKTYLERNPLFVEGNTQLLFIPLNTLDIVYGVLSSIRRRAKKSKQNKINTSGE